jgi:hypothetical protein
MALEIGKEIKSVKKPKLRTIAGILLIIVAIINVIVPISREVSGLVLNSVITLAIFVSGIAILKFDKWLPVRVFGLICAIIGILYSIIKLYVYRSVAIAEEAPEWFNTGLLVFIPMCLVSIAAAALILKWKLSKA